MLDNGVWDLGPLPEGAKPVGFKWVFKTKRNANSKVKIYKARLVAKGYTQKEGIDNQKTFVPLSSKDSLRIIMALIAHLDSELHQMDVKREFIKGDIDEVIYMQQSENFVVGDPNKVVCKLKKSIYRLKQASHQWYCNFHQVITSFGFEGNCIEKHN